MAAMRIVTTAALGLLIACAAPASALRNDGGGGAGAGGAIGPGCADDVGCAATGQGLYYWVADDDGELGAFWFCIHRDSYVEDYQYEGRSVATVADDEVCGVIVKGDPETWGDESRPSVYLHHEHDDATIAHPTWGETTNEWNATVGASPHGAQVDADPHIANGTAADSSVAVHANRNYYNPGATCVTVENGHLASVPFGEAALCVPTG